MSTPSLNHNQQRHMSGQSRAWGALVAACSVQTPAAVYDAQDNVQGLSPSPCSLTHTLPETSRPLGVGTLFHSASLEPLSSHAVPLPGAGLGLYTQSRCNSLPALRCQSRFRKQPAKFIFGRARHVLQDLIEPLHNHRLSLSSVCSRAGSNNASKHGQDHGKGTRELGSFTQGIFSTSKRGEASDD